MFIRRHKRMGVVGLVPGADGTTPSTGRQGKLGEAIVQQSFGKYYESSSRGMMFGACDQGAGITVQTSITTTAALSLFNPLNSNKRLHLSYVDIGYFSGTLGAGSFYHGIIGPLTAATAPTGGTVLTAYCLDTGNISNSGAAGLAYAGATVVAAKAVGVICSTFPELASTANAIQSARYDIDGSIVLEPGWQWQLLGVFGAGGSSPKITGGVSWIEIPLVTGQG